MTCVFFPNLLYSLPQSLTLKKSLYCRLLLYYFRCVKKNICQNTPVINQSTTLQQLMSFLHIYFPPPTWFSLNYEKNNPKSCWSGLEKKIHQYHHTWLQTSVMFPNYATIKSGPGTAGHPYPVWPGTGNGTWNDRKSFGSSNFGLISVSMAMLSWNTCGTYFFTPIYLTETGTILLICFCYYYEFIITITLSIWSDKRCCKKVRWKNKKIRLAVFFLQSKLLFFYIKKLYYILNSPPT